MSGIVPKESIKVIADANGIAALRDEVASALASDVEYRLREVIQESTKFMRHAKRQRLTTSDVNNALRVMNVEPLYGFGAKEPLRFRRVPSVSTTTDLYYADDDEIDCSELIHQPLPALPLAVSYTAHWLAIEGVQPAIPQNPSSAVLRATHVKTAESTVPSDDHVEVRPLVKHVLSKELRQYYDQILEYIFKPEAPVRTAAFNSLRNDPGIHQLVPYFTQLVADKVPANMRNLDVLTSLMMLVRALVDNKGIFIEPYLHQLMPTIITCLVGKPLCMDPSRDNHWALRDMAAELISTICGRFGEAYHTLLSRISKTLLRAFLDPLKPLPTHYGAVVGFAGLGPEVVRVVLLPVVESYMNLLQPELDNLTPEHAARRKEAMQVRQALVRAVGECLKDMHAAVPIQRGLESKEVQGLTKRMRDLFGDALEPYLSPMS